MKGGERVIIKLNSGKILFLLEKDAKYWLAKVLAETMKKIGHSLTFEEAKLIPELPANLNIYAVYFGSFSEACRVASNVVTKYENPDAFRVNRRWEMEKREEILNRVLEISFSEHGNDVSWISETTIKRDPILIYAEVLKAFGGLKQLRMAAKQRIKDGKHGNKRRPKDKLMEVKEMDVTTKKPEIMEQEVESLQEQLEVEKFVSSRKWSREKIIQVLREYYDEHGELPKDRYLCSRYNDAPSVMTVKRYLGNSRVEWLEAIGVKMPSLKPEPQTEPKAVKSELQVEPDAVKSELQVEPEVVESESQVELEATQTQQVKIESTELVADEQEDMANSTDKLEASEQEDVAELTENQKEIMALLELIKDGGEIDRLSKFDFMSRENVSGFSATRVFNIKYGDISVRISVQATMDILPQ